MSDLTAVETYADLAQWLGENMSSASLHELDGEVIIHTGLERIMGDYLEPIGEVYDVPEKTTPKGTGFYWQGNCQ